MKDSDDGLVNTHISRESEFCSGKSGLKKFKGNESNTSKFKDTIELSVKVNRYMILIHNFVLYCASLGRNNLPGKLKILIKKYFSRKITKKIS